MKRLVVVLLLVLASSPLYANHIIGGEMSYRFVGITPEGYQYHISLKLYRGCEDVDNSHAALYKTLAFAIYDLDGTTPTLFANITGIPLRGPDEMSKQREDPCILDPPPVCYRIGYYDTTVVLPLNSHGYVVTLQRCCRDNSLRNVDMSGPGIGATYYTEIPGTDRGVPGDGSPVFDNEEAVLICNQGFVSYSYQATDPDGDSLSYAFVGGTIGGAPNTPSNRISPPPPYDIFSYQDGFAPSAPLGPGVVINDTSGLISGRTNLEPGTYDVCVAVTSYRDGKVLDTHLKDFQVTVHACHRLALADIPTLFNDCRSATIFFPNKSTPGKEYVWDFGDGETSDAYTPTHTYRDAGVYHVWLKVDPSSSCGDSMEAEVRVFPGLKTGFSHEGSCVGAPTAFTDETALTYGKIDSWHWDFGVGAADTAAEGTPSYTYRDTGTYAVRLTVTTTDGCEQSDTQQVSLYGPPPLEVSSDTLLCYLNSLTLHASSPLAGAYRWSPAYRITGAAGADPTVHPDTDTTYHVRFTDTHGCISEDSVQLRVKHTLALEARGDTTLCEGDPLELAATSDDDYAFGWYDDAGQLLVPALNGEVTATASGRYLIRATLGDCESERSFDARVVPYPVAVAAPDTGICAGDVIQLRGSGGAFYSWYPSKGLTDTAVAGPLASPADSTLYTLTVTDTLGCPKPASTTILVAVVPPVDAFAGNDTIITTGQVLQLHGSGANSYEWTPATGLSDPYVSDPVVYQARDVTYQLKAIHAPEGCYGLDTISIRYIRGPDIYVPTAFTPNGDGMNDVFRPIPVGVTRLEDFRVFDRWGKLMYHTSRYLEGWDGRYQGRPAGGGTYVWMVKGRDFNGKQIFRKGTVILIR